MALIADIVSWAALTVGGVFYVIGAIGLNRMPEVFTRMHAVSVGETLGLGLLFFGMLLQAGPTLVAVKLGFIVIGLWTSGAVATHALSRAALHAGERPLIADNSGRLVRTDPVALFPELAVRLAMPLTSETVDEESAAVEPAAATTEAPESLIPGEDEEVVVNPDAELPTEDEES